ncbi:AAA family ATPase [Rhizobium sp. Root1220]|uniref:AAA family ATPase n=1 Tax=Rhizobium sp. Root1220 TaxID=1736432 RepID=UPI0006F8DB36|nr:AAA family ATPase [Rhizobium sp. Root1220]KQV83568.1 hypothetical protein ASC90_19930 [Rhizobium sp. Root1220]
MRINRLDLTRYGKFTDAVFDFGSRPVGSPDLHVIYGPNEAGKSTTFSAILDLIFGIGHSTKYGFLHPYPTMRIGGNVHVGGREREFVRVKRPQNSLLDGDDRTVADTEILADLGGIDRGAFSTMFSLDEETLKSGGESILASKGDLGELLFSASAGLSDLSRRLGEIRAHADGFYKFRARNTQLAELKTRLADLKQRREELDLQASDFTRMKSELSAHEERYREALEQLSMIQRRSQEINRILRALPTMTRLVAQQDELAKMPIVPEPPSFWKTDLSVIRKETIELRVKIDSVARSIADVESEIHEIPDPAEVLAFAGRAEELLKTLEPRYITAQVDIPKLKGRIAELSVEALLRQLGKPGEKDPARLVLVAATVGRFRSLINTKSGVDARLDNAAKELARTDRALSEEDGTYDRFIEYKQPERRRAFETLAATVNAISKADDETSLRLLTRRRDTAEADLLESMAQLTPWRGGPEELAAMPVPLQTTLDKWKMKHSEARDAAKTATSDIERLRADLGRLDAEIDGIRGRSGEIDETSAITSRAVRDEAWVSHRQALTVKTALDFERAMRADDQILSQRLLHFAETGKLAQLRLTRAVVEADLRTADQRLSVAENALVSLASEMLDSFADVREGQFLTRDPAELQEWIRRRTVALAARDELGDIDQEMADVHDRSASVKARFVAALKATKINVLDVNDTSSLVAVAESELDRFNSAMEQADRLERLNADRVERGRVLEEARNADAEWNTKWEEVCASCWLKGEPCVPDADAVNAIIPILEKLSSAIEMKDSLLDRVQKMEKDAAVFEQAVFDLCGALSIRQTGSLSDMTRAIGEEIKVAERGKERIEKLTEALYQAREQEKALMVSRQIVAGRIDEMTAFFGCASVDEVESQIDLYSKRQALQTVVTDLERELLEIAGFNDIGQVAQQLSQADRVVLEIELEGMKPILANHEKACRDAFHEVSTLEKSLDAVGGDAAVAQIEEQRRTTLLEIEERAGSYLELRIGIAAAEQAIKLYRDRHRSGMMSRASVAFCTISRGAYTGVAAQPGKDGEVLMAVSANGGSMSADALSRGARFQLYLALRVAGYHEFIAGRPGVPFIADDIMETFDDFRAEEAFRLFAGMAQHGQVIYLTHHRHLTDIVRKVCPSVRIYDFEQIKRTAGLDGIAAE